MVNSSNGPKPKPPVRTLGVKSSTSSYHTPSPTYKAPSPTYKAPVSYNPYLSQSMAKTNLQSYTVKQNNTYKAPAQSSYKAYTPPTYKAPVKTVSYKPLQSQNMVSPFLINTSYKATPVTNKVVKSPSKPVPNAYAEPTPVKTITTKSKPVTIFSPIVNLNYNKPIKQPSKSPTQLQQNQMSKINSMFLSVNAQPKKQPVQKQVPLKSNAFEYGSVFGTPTYRPDPTSRIGAKIGGTEGAVIDRIRLEQKNSRLSNEQQRNIVNSILNMNFGVESLQGGADKQARKNFQHSGGKAIGQQYSPIPELGFMLSGNIYNSSDKPKPQKPQRVIGSYINTKVSPIKNPTFTFGKTALNDYGGLDSGFNGIGMSEEQLQGRIDSTESNQQLIQEADKRRSNLGLRPIGVTQNIQRPQKVQSVQNKNSDLNNFEDWGISQPQSPQVKVKESQNMQRPKTLQFGDDTNYFIMNNKPVKDKVTQKAVSYPITQHQGQLNESISPLVNDGIPSQIYNGAPKAQKEKGYYGVITKNKKQTTNLSPVLVPLPSDSYFSENQSPSYESADIKAKLHGQPQPTLGFGKYLDIGSGIKDEAQNTINNLIQLGGQGKNFIGETFFGGSKAKSIADNEKTKKAFPLKETYASTALFSFIDEGALGLGHSLEESNPLTESNYNKQKKQIADQRDKDLNKLWSNNQGASFGSALYYPVEEAFTLGLGGLGSLVGIGGKITKGVAKGSKAGRINPVIKTGGQSSNLISNMYNIPKTAKQKSIAVMGGKLPTKVAETEVKGNIWNQIMTGVKRKTSNQAGMNKHLSGTAQESDNLIEPFPEVNSPSAGFNDAVKIKYGKQTFYHPEGWNGPIDKIEYNASIRPKEGYPAGNAHFQQGLNKITGEETSLIAKQKADVELTLKSIPEREREISQMTNMVKQQKARLDLDEKIASAKKWKRDNNVYDSDFTWENHLNEGAPVYRPKYDYPYQNQMNKFSALEGSPPTVKGSSLLQSPESFTGFGRTNPRTGRMEKVTSIEEPYLNKILDLKTDLRKNKSTISLLEEKGNNRPYTVNRFGKKTYQPKMSLVKDSISGVSRFENKPKNFSGLTRKKQLRDLRYDQADINDVLTNVNDDYGTIKNLVDVGMTLSPKKVKGVSVIDYVNKPSKISKPNIESTGVNWNNYASNQSWLGKDDLLPTYKSIIPDLRAGKPTKIQRINRASELGVQDTNALGGNVLQSKRRFRQHMQEPEQEVMVKLKQTDESGLFNSGGFGSTLITKRRGTPKIKGKKFISNDNNIPIKVGAIGAGAGLVGGIIGGGVFVPPVEGTHSPPLNVYDKTNVIFGMNSVLKDKIPKGSGSQPQQLFTIQEQPQKEKQKEKQTRVSDVIYDHGQESIFQYPQQYDSKQQSKQMELFSLDYKQQYKVDQAQKQQYDLYPMLDVQQDKLQDLNLKQDQYQSSKFTPDYPSKLIPTQFQGWDYPPIQKTDQLQRNVYPPEFPPSQRFAFTPFFNDESSKDDSGNDNQFFRVFAISKEPFGKTAVPFGEFVDKDRPIFEISDALSKKTIFRVNRNRRNPLRAPVNIADEYDIFNVGNLGRQKKKSEISIFMDGFNL